jgi:hypothetical protein
MKIKKINKIRYDNSIPVYCVNIPFNHEIIIQCKKKCYITKQSINFQLEFGATAFNFAKTVIEKEWTLEDCKKYIQENNLQNIVNNRLTLLNNDNDNKIFQSIENKEDYAIYWAIASDIRTKHFEKYSGLKTWIEDTIQIAKKQGYVRSPYGAIRRLPQLQYEGKNTNLSIIKNLSNISLNSPVQNIEVVLINTTNNHINKIIKERKMKSRLISNVHDAIIGYVHKDELKEFWEISNTFFEIDKPENMGIPLELECNYADISQGEVWKFGKKYK